MSTARTLIRRAMLDVGVLTKSENPSADEANDALDELNALSDSWSNDPGLFYTRVQETFPLSAAASYSIGAGQTFNTVRPLQIVKAYISDGTIDTPVTIINQEVYDNITFKEGNGIPQYLTYNAGFPYGTITLYPVPNGGYTLTILSEKPFTGFATLDTEVTLPAGWFRALQKNLALELGPQYGQDPTPALVRAAAQSLGALKLATVRLRPVPQFTSSGRNNNIYSGWSY